jgi:hypothetical protein
MPLQTLARREHGGWMDGLSAAQNAEPEASKWPMGLRRWPRRIRRYGAL